MPPLLIACGRTDAPAPTTSVVDRGMHPAWSKNAVIYEVNIRQYTPEGTFAAFTRELPRLKSLGVDVLWLMPVQPIGTLNRKGGLGSYYSIADYTAFNPEFGTEADFVALVDAAHKLGMKVLLDWVANHTAFDHAWTTTHKEWYTLRADGSISRAIDDKGKETDWSDVADLNYSSQPMRTAMLTEMRWWLEHTGIDGFRCDMAGFVPRDFWKQVSDTLRATHPDLFMLAEWEDAALHESFDATYGWELHHLLNDVARGRHGATALTAYFARQDSLYRRSAYRLYFTSNHDENSWQGTEFERMGENHRPAYVLSATVQNSLPLLYTGQEASLSKRLRFFDKDTVDWSGPSLADFYGALFALRHTQQAVWNGPWGGKQSLLETDGGEQVFAYSRTRDSSTVVVLVNFDSTDATVRYEGLGAPGTYTDWFSKQTLTLAATQAVTIPRHGFRVLVRGGAVASSR